MQLRPRDERVLLPGMTFHLVPGVHLEGVGYVAQTLTVVITESGCESLSALDLLVDPV